MRRWPQCAADPLRPVPGRHLSQLAFVVRSFVEDANKVAPFADRFDQEPSTVIPKSCNFISSHVFDECCTGGEFLGACAGIGPTGSGRVCCSRFWQRRFPRPGDQGALQASKPHTLYNAEAFKPLSLLRGLKVSHGATCVVFKSCCQKETCGADQQHVEATPRVLLPLGSGPTSSVFGCYSMSSEVREGTLNPKPQTPNPKP